MTNPSGTCKQCGQYFTRTENRGRKIYCSKKCYRQTVNVKKSPEYWKQRNERLKASGEVKPVNRIKMPGPRLVDGYDWGMIRSLPRSDSYS